MRGRHIGGDRHLGVPRQNAWRPMLITDFWPPNERPRTDETNPAHGEQARGHGGRPSVALPGLPAGSRFAYRPLPGPPGLLRYWVERRNWIYGGRRRFWDVALVLFVVSTGLTALELLVLYLLVGDFPSGWVLWFLFLRPLVGGVVVWRWWVSRRFHDGGWYRSHVGFVGRFTRADGGAVPGRVVLVLRPRWALRLSFRFLAGAVFRRVGLTSARS